MGSYLVKIYMLAALDASQRIRGSWSAIVGLLALALGLLLINTVSVHLGILGGFLQSIYQAVAITYYLGWLRESSQFRRLRFSELKSFDWGLFQSVISILFILYLLQWGVVMLTTGMNAGWAFAILQMLVVVLLNSLPETLYLTRRDGMDGIQESFSFTTANWIEWYLPYLIILSPLLLMGGYSLPTILAQTHIFSPALAVISVPAILFPGLQVLVLPLGLILSHWFMLFRAKLYQELEGGSRRQRIFKSRM
jgi:hypothetical protein